MGVIRYYAYRFRIYYGVFPFSPPSGERVGERGLVKKVALRQDVIDAPGHSIRNSRAMIPILLRLDSIRKPKMGKAMV